MKLTKKELILLGRKNARAFVEAAVGPLYDENKLETYTTGEFENSLLFQGYGIYDIWYFRRCVSELLNTNNLVDPKTEKAEANAAFTKLAGLDLRVPEKYQGIVSRYREDLFSQASWAFSRLVSDSRNAKKGLYALNDEVELLLPSESIRKQTLKHLSDRSFKDDGYGLILNVNTDEDILFDGDMSLRDLIGNYQQIAIEEKIDGLFPEEEVRKSLGIDELIYEKFGMEKCRQNILNLFRQLDLSYSEAMSMNLALHNNLKSKTLNVMKNHLERNSDRVDAEKALVHGSDGVTPTYEYKSRVYQRQSWTYPYK